MLTPAEQMRKTIQLMETQELDEIGRIGSAIAGAGMAAIAAIGGHSAQAQPVNHPSAGLPVAVSQGEFNLPREAFMDYQRLGTAFASAKGVAQAMNDRNAIAAVDKLRSQPDTLARDADDKGEGVRELWSLISEIQNQDDSKIGERIAAMRAAMSKAMGNFIGRQDQRTTERGRQAARDALRR